MLSSIEHFKIKLKVGHNQSWGNLVMRSNHVGLEIVSVAEED